MAMHPYLASCFEQWVWRMLMCFGGVGSFFLHPPPPPPPSPSPILAWRILSSTGEQVRTTASTNRQTHSALMPPPPLHHHHRRFRGTCRNGVLKAAHPHYLSVPRPSATRGNRACLINWRSSMPSSVPTRAMLPVSVNGSERRTGSTGHGADAD